jgi:ubiquinone/menaquinone biosynthesis C-methylase UbiE
MNKAGFVKVYNRIAPVYDKWFGKSCQDSYPLIINEISAFSIKFNNILDIGCGTGKLLEVISKEIRVNELFGIDPSENMIKVAKRRMLPQSKFIVGFAESLPFDDQSLDCVVCTAAFSHFISPALALREIRRVLRPKGHCIIIDHKKPNVIIKLLLSSIKLLAKYLDVKDIENIIMLESFEIIKLRETKKYFIASIVPVVAC